LRSPNGNAVGAKLSVSHVSSVNEGMQRVKDITMKHSWLRGQQ